MCPDDPVLRLGVGPHGVQVDGGGVGGEEAGGGAVPLQVRKYLLLQGDALDHSLGGGTGGGKSVSLLLIFISSSVS